MESAIVPAAISAVEQTLFFTGFDQFHGSELWQVPLPFDGDVDNAGRVDVDDVDTLCNAIRDENQSVQFDINLDGIVDFRPQAIRGDQRVRGDELRPTGAHRGDGCIAFRFVIALRLCALEQLQDVECREFVDFRAHRHLPGGSIVSCVHVDLDQFHLLGSIGDDQIGGRFYITGARPLPELDAFAARDIDTMLSDLQSVFP